MESLNFYTIINYLSFFNICFLSILSLIVSYLIIAALFQYLVQKYTDLYQYKITNIYLSFFWASIYILVFILLFYILRIYNVNTGVNLYEVYSNICKGYNWFMMLSLSLVWRIYYVVICSMFLIISLLIMQNFYKYMIKHIFLLYLYFYEEKKAHISPHYLYQFLANLRDIGQENVILYYLKDILINIKQYFLGRYPSFHKLNKFNIFRIFWKILYYKKLETLLVISPLTFIVYDCIFNDFIITHVFYYLLIYIPMMILKRVTTCMGTSAGYIVNLLQDIYYKEEEEDCIYVLSPTDKKVLDIYLLNGLRFEVEIDLNVTFSIYNVARFVKNDIDRDAYMNNIGEYIRIIDGKAFRELEVDDDKWETTYILGEEWVLLAIKNKASNI